MRHREPSCHLCEHDDRGTIDLIVPQKIPVGETFFHRDDPAGHLSVFIHQFPCRAAQNVAGLVDAGKLLLQFFPVPGIIRIQESDIFAPGKQNPSVAALRRSKVMLIVEKDHFRMI